MKIKRLVLGLFLFVLAFLGYRFSTHQEVLLFLFPEKIWVHRVNSLEKLNEVTPKFGGVELDVVWEGADFDVNHPPASSIGLSLDEYLGALPKDKELGLWLDYKNLNSLNANISLEKLDLLVRDHNLNKKNIKVESKKPELLGLFRDRGYLTSYYLPQGLDHQDQSKATQTQTEIRELKENYPSDYLSSSLGEYIYVNKNFPNHNKLLWHLGGMESFKNKRRIYKALLDKNVELILLPYVSENGDR
ncbi:MAG: hypothetical protein ACQEWD_04420 [Bacteroidota bacterium]